MRQSSGFTLIELLIVIVILAITASIAALAFRGKDNTQSNLNALNVLSARLQLARELAIAHSSVVRLHLVGNHYQFEEAIHAPHQDNITWQVLTENRALRPGDFEGHECALTRANQPVEAVQIYPNGVMDAVTLTLQDKGMQCELRVQASGQMSVKAMPHE